MNNYKLLSCSREAFIYRFLFIKISCFETSISTVFHFFVAKKRGLFYHVKDTHFFMRIAFKRTQFFQKFWKITIPSIKKIEKYLKILECQFGQNLEFMKFFSLKSKPLSFTFTKLLLQHFLEGTIELVKSHKV